MLQIVSNWLLVKSRSIYRNGRRNRKQRWCADLHHTPQQPQHRIQHCFHQQIQRKHLRYRSPIRSGSSSVDEHCSRKQYLHYFSSLMIFWFMKFMSPSWLTCLTTSFLFNAPISQQELYHAHLNSLVFNSWRARLEPNTWCWPSTISVAMISLCNWRRTSTTHPGVTW